MQSENANSIKFGFDAEFQRKVIKLALLDDGFCTAAIQHVRPEMFESDALRWCWQNIMREREAQRTPTALVLRDKLRHVEPVVQPRYAAMLQAIEQDQLREEHYVRYSLAEFVARNVFVAAYQDSQKLYNMGRVNDAIDVMKREADRAARISFASPARYWFYAELEDRQRQRKERARREYDYTFPTGIVGVDEVLDGGLSIGELGCWMGDAKAGKSIMLVHLACYAARALMRKVLLVLLEGSYLQTASRMDAWHAAELYNEVKRGTFSYEAFARLQDEYRSASDRLVIRQMTDSWSYSAADIQTELTELAGNSGWRPAMLVVDYGDLLRSQTGKNLSEEQHQRDAFGDLQVLCKRDAGYAVWTVSQARRPRGLGKSAKDAKDDNGNGEGGEVWRGGKPVLSRGSMSDSYNKVRRVDFLGSINQDAEDKTRHEARLYLDIYRDNAADTVVKVKQDLNRMRFVDLMDPLNRPDRASAVLDEMDKKSKQAVPEKAALEPEKLDLLP